MRVGWGGVELGEAVTHKREVNLYPVTSALYAKSDGTSPQTLEERGLSFHFYIELRHLFLKGQRKDHL